MKRLLGILLAITASVATIGGVPGLATFAATGLPFNGWVQMSGGYVQVPYQEEINLEPGNGSFTIEGWINYSFSYANGSTTVIEKEDSFELSLSTTYNSYNQKWNYSVNFWQCSGTVCVSTLPHVIASCTYSCPPQGWFHFAYVYDQEANTGALYWNGSRLGSNEYLPNISSEPITIQVAYKVDEFRISHNVRYTASFFTPPPVPFECDAGTGALWHFDEISGSTVFHDECGAVDNTSFGYDGAHTEGVTGFKAMLPMITK